MIKTKKEEWLIKEKAETNPAHGGEPHARPVEQYIKNGFIILDKPAGPTSHQVAAWVRDIFKDIGVKKVGHAGTLDPHVTGVLPLMIQETVKIAPVLAGAQKEYVCLMKLHKEVDEEKIRQLAKQFIGKITQVPPRKAAVKKVPRVREVRYFEILEIKETNVLFKIGTEAGFYVRKLCVDFGKALGVGAHMAQLRRIRAGPFTEEKAITLQEVRDAYEWWRDEKDDRTLRETIKPLEFALVDVKKILIKDAAVGAVAYGAPLHVGGIAQLNSGIKESDPVAIMSLKGELVALGKAKLTSEAMMKKRAGVAATIQRVIMARDVYPRVWK